MIPGGGAISRLPALIGRAKALEVILGSVPLDGRTAERYGVVNRAVPDRELDGFVDSLAANIASYDRQIIADVKALINRFALPVDNTDLLIAYKAFLASVDRLAVDKTDPGNG